MMILARIIAALFPSRANNRALGKAIRTRKAAQAKRQRLAKERQRMLNRS